MRLHQVLTGAANTSENGASVAYGCFEDYPYIVYSSGCDVVILDSRFQRVQIVTRQCATSNHVGLISCSESDGKIAVAYGTRIRVFAPKSSVSSNQNKSLPFEWSLVSEFSTSYILNCLVWDRDGKRLLTGGQLLELWIESSEEGNHQERQVVWKSSWQCATSTPVYHVQFSSDGSYFASLGKNDCLVKVWFEIEKGNPLILNQDPAAAFYDFIYIPHPQPVAGFSWRKTSSFMPRNCVANALLTSCADNICRIWCETVEQKSVNGFPEDQNQTAGHHCERHKVSPTPEHVDAASSLQSEHHFHIAVSIDPAKDIPIMSTVSFFTDTENRSSFVLHWVNNKEMFITSVANLLLGSPSVTVEVESVCSEMSEGQMVDSPYDMLGEEEVEDSHIGDTINDSYEGETILSPSNAQNEDSTTKRLEKPESELLSNNLLSQFGMLLREWRRSPDSLLAINPADGSLLVWLVESLDACLGSDFRQAQVSFSSCIPSVFPSADAHSLLQNLMLYRLPGKLNMQTYGPGELLSPTSTHGRTTKASILTQDSDNRSLVSVETGAHPPVAMISTHKDGSMNQWQIDFADNSAFSTLISISHLTRLSGHRFPLTGMFAHPSLPLLLSVSTFTAKQDEDDADSMGQSPFSFSELILWQCDSVFPLSQNGGIMELAKITSTASNAFDKIAWLPKLFIHSLLTFDPSVSLSPRCVSPCACFVASDDTGLRFYQVVLDGRALLDFLSGKQTHRRGMERANSLENEDSEGPDAEYPAVSSIHSLLHCIVSDQSGARPGSVLKLCRLTSSRNVLRDPFFLHAFSEHAVAEGGTRCKSGSEESWCEDNFYLVALENEEKTNDARTMVHMWRIEITTTSGEDDDSGLSSEQVVLSPNETSPTNTSSFAELREKIRCGIRSRKVLTSPLDLPDGVCVTMATASVNTLSAVSENKSCSLPYLVATTCSDGVFRFWTCEVTSSCGGEVRKYRWVESAVRTNGLSDSIRTVGTSGVNGVPVCIDCANSRKVAVVVRLDRDTRGESAHDVADYRVVVWESESRGDTEWVLEDSFEIEDNQRSSFTNHACVKWFSCEDGSFVLVVGINGVLHLYSLLRTKGDESAHVNGSVLNHRYKRLQRVETRSCTVATKHNVFVSFVRRGLLVVGIGYEVHVYSQWKDAAEEENGVVVASADALRNPGLFNQVLRRNPTLPQYHPKYLMELLNFGKLRRVRAILNHLVRCVSGDKATEADVCNDGEAFRSRTRSVISTLSRTTSLSTTPVDFPTRGDTSHQSAVDCIPPIPITDLLAADNDESGNAHKHLDAVKIDEGASAETNEERDYSELFQSSFKSSFDSSEMAEHPSAVSHTKQSISLVHFGLTEAGLLAEHLSRKQLPGLTRTEQLELQALADTLATTKTDLEERSSEIDRGLKFARKHDPASDQVAAFVGGPGGGGGGYATTGSIGATEGSGGDVVDDCGLRFLLAMRHHTCLLRSLPLAPRAQLERKGLSSSKFVWAFHSDTQEELLAMLPEMIRGEPTWHELRQYGVGWWVKSNETLRRLVEKVAKAQFNSKQDPMDCSLFYMAMKKKSVIRGLFRTQGDSRMASFFGNNFSEERWRKAALKNAYSLLSKQRFEHAVAFFLLAGALWDAIRLCVSRLKDVQLALVIARLYGSDMDNLKRVLMECVLGTDEQSCDAKKDPFLRSISYWLVIKYHKALRTLLLEPGPDTNHIEGTYNALAATGSPDIFNFYIYLRTHPLLRRSKFQKDPKANTPSMRRKKYRINSEQSFSEAVMLPSPLTAFERRLYFMTAHNHYNAGCPDLSLQIALELPPPTKETPADQMKDDRTLSTGEIQENPADKNQHMIDTGTLDIDWSRPVASKLKQNEPNSNCSDFDWSQPVSTKLGGSKVEENSSKFDWSKPVSTKLGGSEVEESTSNFDWSKPVSTKLGSSSDIDCSKPICSNSKANGTPDVLLSKEIDEEGCEREDQKLAVSDCENSSEPADHKNCATEATAQNVDAVCQRLKFKACLKLVVEELCTLPYHCQIHNKDLRSTFNTWLKKELDLIHRICDYEGDRSSTDSFVPLKISTPTALEAASQEALDEMLGNSMNEKKNFAQKVEISAKHIEWLKENQTLLNVLLNYCTLHGASGGDVATMKVELLILIHELEQQRHLMSPLYLISAGSSIPPLILATMVSTFSLGASPFTYLSSMTQDILKHLTKLPGPPSPSQPLEMVSVLRSLSATLSACVFQSLVCRNDDGDTSPYDLTPRGPSPIHGRSDISLGITNHLKPTSSSTKWPGVRLLRSLLITEAKDNATKLKVLLCEVCVAIYLSLLSIAWCENDANQLYHIICNSLTSEMWGMTFGGGRKVKERTPLSTDESKRQSMSPTRQAHGTYWEAARRRWNFKLLQAPAKEMKGEKQTTENEEFVAPQLSLMEYFLRKPKVDPAKTFNFDSEASVSSESEGSDDAFEMDDERVVKMKRKKVKPLDHLDPKSFTWKLMNYAVSTLVCRNINTFLTDVGLEVSDLPTVSPLLHSANKMLEHWNQVLFSQLKKCGPPPLGYVCLFTMSEDEFPRGGPTLMKYKALTDPSNTPFRSTSASANPAKRLWHTLVYKEELQKIFLEFVFRHPDQPTAKEDEADHVDEQAKILYKDSEAINAFCISKTNVMRVVVATLRDVLEIDISNVLGSSRTYYVDEDMGDMEKRQGDQDDFAMIYNDVGNETGQMPFLGQSIGGQSGIGSSVLLKRNMPGVKRMEEHPNLPYYLTGGQDGSLRMWEFGHAREIASYREGGKFQRVTKLHFSQHGCKFGVMDFGGQLSLYQSVNTSNTKSFKTLKCHNKQGNDFAFLGSTSLFATAGHSSDGSNVCLWDTLIPPPSSLIHAFTCHENGAPCVVYVPGKRLLLSGGRKGNVCIFDVRQRQLVHTFAAHDSDVKSIAVGENGEFFVTGSLDGDMKMWNLSAHEELLSFPGEHGKSNYQLIKLGTQGVPRISIKSGGQMFSCGGDGTLKWRQLPLKNLIVNSPF